jgi:two-component system, sensor histidine kinase and response regulator
MGAVNLMEVFTEFEDSAEEQRRFIAFLERHLPGYVFRVLAEQESSINPSAYKGKKNRLPAHDNPLVRAVSMGEKGVTLMALPKNSKDAFPSAHVALDLAIELFYSQKGLEITNGLLEVQKKQADRSAKVLEEKYQEILAENHQNHEEMRRQQALHAQNLKEEIAKQTGELREANERLSKAKRELEQTNRELEKAIERSKEMALEAGRANEAKSQFLAAMSHEIRTPLNAIIGFSDMLLESRLSRKQSDYAGIIRRSSEALLSLINDILDLSKVEAGRMALEKCDFDPSAVAREVCELVGPTTKGKSVTLSCHVDPALPPLIRGDSKRFRQVLVNLLGNAAKFTDAGLIELRLGILESRDEQVKLLGSIRDTGIGIAEDKRGMIFEPFVQIDGSISRKYEGTGLGLSVSKKLVELMGGDIWFESKPGMGSVFCFTAWMERTTMGSNFGKGAFKAYRGHRGPQAVLPDLKEAGIRVLLAEDNPVNQKLAGLILKKAGCEVEVAATGQEAVEKYTRACGRYRLILMDVQMPGMDGLQATGEIRRWEQKQDKAMGRVHIPIIAMTAQALDGDREKCLKAGMDDYMSKPITKEIVLEKIREWGLKEFVTEGIQAAKGVG